MMPRVRLALALAILAAAPGCAAVSAISTATQPLEAYALTPASMTATRGATGRHLVVDTPTTGGGIDTDRILIKPTPNQAQYLAGARWVDPAPVLVQSLLIAALQDTDAFRHVGWPAAGPLPDYTLLTDIRTFEAEATTAEGPPFRAEVRLVLSLVREEDARIIASRSFEADALAASVEPLVLVPAFNAATDQAVADAAAWILGLFGLTG